MRHLHLHLGSIRRWNRVAIASAALLVPLAMTACSADPKLAPAPAPAQTPAPAAAPAGQVTVKPQANAQVAQPTAAAPVAKPMAAAQATTAPASAKGSWYLSTNATPGNWSKTGMFYEKPWEDHVDVGDNTTLELYVKAMTPHTIEVFNARKLSLGIDAHPDATHTKTSGGVTLGDYVQLKDQNWTKVSIPLTALKDLNLHEVFFMPALPQALGTGEYSLGIDEVRFVGGSKPVVWYGDEHPNNPITTHGPGMTAVYMPTGGVDVDAMQKK